VKFRKIISIIGEGEKKRLRSPYFALGYDKNHFSIDFLPLFLATF